MTLSVDWEADGSMPNVRGRCAVMRVRWVVILQ